MTDHAEALTLEGIERIVEDWITHLRRVHPERGAPVGGTADDGVVQALRAVLRMLILVAGERVDGKGDALNLGTLLSAALLQHLRDAMVGDISDEVRRDPRIASGLRSIVEERLARVALARLPASIRAQLDGASVVGREVHDPDAGTDGGFFDAIDRLLRVRERLTRWRATPGPDLVEAFGDDLTHLEAYARTSPTIEEYFSAMRDELDVLFDAADDDATRRQTPSSVRARFHAAEQDSWMHRDEHRSPRGAIVTADASNRGEEYPEEGGEATGFDHALRPTEYEVFARDPARLPPPPGILRPSLADRDPGELVDEEDEGDAEDRRSDEIPIHPMPSPPVARGPEASAFVRRSQAQVPTMQVRTRKFPAPKQPGGR